MAVTMDGIIATLVHSPSLLGSLAILVVTLLVRYYLDRPGKLDLPSAEIDESDYHGSLIRAKKKFGIKPFIFRMPEPRVVLPNYLFEEVKNLPDDQLSFRQAVVTILNGKWTGLAQGVTELASAVQNELTLNINSTLAVLQDEISWATEKEIGSLTQPTEVNIYSKLLRIVAYASGRVFVGLPLSRDEEWVDITVNYTVNAGQSVIDVQTMPLYQRWLRVPFLPSIRKSQEYRARIRKKLEPLVQDLVEQGRRSQLEKHDDDDDESHSKLKSDMANTEFNLAAWSLKYYPPGQAVTAQSISQTLLQAAFAAIHTTTMSLANILYDLAAHPEYAQELREEMEAVLAESEDGKLWKRTIPKLRKLDSFIMESQRVHPLGAATLLRLVTAKSGIRFSTGDFLPRGTIFAVAQARHNSALDPSLLSPQPPQPSLDEFHPWRFADLRAHPGEENKHQFVTTTHESTVFGHGRWACPGRFFAANEIKSILVELLRRYDISVGPDGQGEGGEFKRPMTYTIKMGYFPDPGAKIWLRDRK